MKNEYQWDSSEVSPGHVYIDPVVMSMVHKIKPKRVLDLGCGNGVLTRLIKQHGYEVVGVDPSESGVDSARANAPDIDFRVCGVYDDPDSVDLGKFDLVVSEEVVEHLYYPGKLLSFANKVLLPGGKLIMTTPYYGYLRNMALAVFNRWDHHLTPLWDHGHIKLFSRASMEELIRRNGFKLLEFKGAGNFRYFWRSMVVLCEPLGSTNRRGTEPDVLPTQKAEGRYIHRNRLR